ncbi:MAG: hypothetical protein PHV30_02805 [Candidatus Margulisbacteria bacterium]|nr:hypothetical protein [Candidatus Margulisiibacteriota bacterium]
MDSFTSLNTSNTNYSLIKPDSLKPAIKAAEDVEPVKTQPIKYGPSQESTVPGWFA